MAKEAPSVCTYRTTIPSHQTALASLAPPVAHWFRQRYAQPTAAQALAWPSLAAGEHLLLSAPTGHGKTLAAFLPIFSGLWHGDAGGVQALYLAPLKALVQDARRTLRTVTAELQVAWRIEARTGDTPAHSRKRLFTEPPTLLLTTPESCALLLTHAAAADLFRTLRWVIVDEVHAFAVCKRGVDLSVSLERLATLAELPLQRIGLSATCAPLETAARFLVGTERPCTIAQVAEPTALDLHIEPLPSTHENGTVPAGSFLARVVERLVPELERQRTTLVFANVRSLAERLVWALRRRLPELAEQIAVHHSSVGAGRRRLAEKRLKRGELRVVVCSTSLELGIDIGAVEGVVLLHPPGAVVRLLQRVGRAGHGPGRLRRGLVLTSDPADLLAATVTCAASRTGQLEPLRVPEQPLDVLCQQLLGMASQGAWLPEEALALVRRAWAFRALSAADFAACLDYLSGAMRHEQPWLPARLRWEGDCFTLLDARTLKLLRRNLGTILGEATMPVRLLEGGAVGDLDAAYAERLLPGERFLLDGRCLEYRREESGAILVEETPGRPATPRWRSDGGSASAELAQRLYVLRTRAAEALLQGPDALAVMLRGEYQLNEPAVATLVRYFQMQETISEIPDLRTCLVEGLHTPEGADYCVHTPLHRAANETLARLVLLRLQRGRGRASLAMTGDLGFVLAVEGRAELSAEEWRSLLSVAAFDADLEATLVDSLLLRERFRRVAYTGLMLLRNPLGQAAKVGGHDWAERRLFAQVRTERPDFVLLRQARHEVEHEVLDVPAAREYLAQMPQRMIRCRWLCRISPFAEHWTQLQAHAETFADDPMAAFERLHAALHGAGVEDAAK